MRTRNAVLFLSLATTISVASIDETATISDAVDGELLVRLDVGVDEASLPLPREIDALPLERLDREEGGPLDRWRRLVYRGGHAPEVARSLLAGLDGIARVELNLLATPTAIPDDTYAGGPGAWREGTWGQPYADLWGLQAMQADLAWDVETGDPGVIVALIDSGVDTGHPDLAGNLWTNLGEIPGNGIDDDGNGYVDDVSGWSFAYGNGDVFDRFWHGTHQAGIIAARGNNGLGIPGVMWDATLMPVKSFDDTGAGAMAWIAAGIVYAADNGADVIQLGFSFRGQPSELLRDAVRYAHDAGAVLIASVGNSNADIGDCNTGFPAPRAMSFPSCYRETIAVGAVDRLGARSEFSNFGPAVDLVAPGGDNDDGSRDEIYNNILSLRASMPPLEPHLEVDDLYFRNRGTSMSAAYVAGIAGLILSHRPGTHHELVRAALQASAEDLGAAGWEADFGFGRANAWQALQQIDAMQGKPELVLFSATADRAVAAANSPVTIDVTVTNAGSAIVSGAALQLWDGNPDDGGTLLASRSLGPIPAKTEAPVQVVTTLADRGVHTLWAVLDPGDPANDPFAANNRRSLEVEIYEYRFVETRITDNVGRQGNPNMSGDRLVWEDYRDNPAGADAYMLDLVTGIESRVTDSAYDEQNPKIHGDIVVWGDHRPKSPDPSSWDIYYQDLRGGGERQVTDIDNAELYPDVYGNLIVWMDTRNGLGNSDIYAYDIETGQELQITSGNSNQEDPAIYGNRIVWEDYRNNQPDIYMYDVNTDAETPLVTAPGDQRLPEISGDRVVYEDSRHGDWEVYVYDISTGQEQRLTFSAGVWQINPDIGGDIVVYQDFIVDGQSEIFMHDLTTGDSRRVTFDGAHQRYPVVEGRYIAWEDFRNADPNTGVNWDVYLSTIDDFPEAPLGLSASGGNDSAQLSWAASNEADVNGYNVYRRSGSSGYMQIATTTDTTYADPGLASAIYTYRVTALDTGLNVMDGKPGESPYSNEASATVGTPAPGSSDGLLLDRDASGELVLSWNADCANGTGYGIYRGDLNVGYDSAQPEPGFCDVTGTSATLPLGAGQADFFLVVPNDGAREGSYGRDSGGARTPPASTCYSDQAVAACSN